MEVSFEQFTKDVTSSGLLPAEELAAVQKEQPAVDAADLAKKLVRAGRLTKYQAANAVQGKAKNLVFGEYVVLDKIGAGGMGQVFKAEHRRMKRVVALKILPPSAVKSPDAVRRFEREVQAAARLEHPNIVAAFDAGEGNGVHFLVMQYVEGRDLSSLVKQYGSLPVADAVDYITQAARGLAYAHAAGMVHRDIKPANLLLDKFGMVKILDMGLARFDDDGQLQEEGLTTAGQVMGTIDYMAPEQAENTHQADHRADIYSLGCTLYRMLIGETPYQGGSTVKTILAHRNQPIPSLRAKRPEISEGLDQVFQRMVAKRPVDRFQTMNDVVAALASCQPAKNPGDPTMTLAWTVNQAPMAMPAGALDGGNQATETFVLNSPTNVGSGSMASATLFETTTMKKTLKRSKRSTPKVIGGALGAIIILILLAFGLKYADVLGQLKPSGKGATTDKGSSKKAAAPKPPPPPIKFTDGQPIDVLALVDPIRDKLDGKWEKRGGALHLDSPEGGGLARMQLPVEPTNEYDVMLLVSRPKSALMNEGLNLIFLMDGHQGSVVMDGLKSRVWGIQRIDGKSRTGGHGVFATNKPEIGTSTCGVKIKVRRGGVTVACNEERILDWSGQGEQLSLRPELMIPNKLSMGLVWHADFTIHQLTVFPGGNDWASLFTGHDLRGWKTSEGDRWKVDKEAAMLVGYGGASDGNANWLLTDHEYHDYRLRLEFQLTKAADGGVALRSESKTGDADQLEIQLADDLNVGKNLRTGSIRNLPSGKEKDTLPGVPPELKPLGSWNELEVELRDRSLRVWINGRQIQNAELKAPVSDSPKKPPKGSKRPPPPPESGKKGGEENAKVVPGLRHTKGHIGLQIGSGQMRYRNIVIHELRQ